MRNVRFFIEVLILAVVLSFSSQSIADNYVSLGFVNTNYNTQPPDSFFFDDNANGYEVTIGFPMPVSWLYTELSLSDNGTSTNNMGFANYELNSQSMAILLHGAIPIATVAGHTIKAHARLGYSATQFAGSETISNQSVTDTDIGLTYGLGASIWLTPHWGIELDYLQRQHNVSLVPSMLTAYHMQHGILKAVYVF